MTTTLKPICTGGAYGLFGVTGEDVRATIVYIKQCQERRAAIRANPGCGYYVSYTNDPAWLVQQAINRRAGWCEGRHTRGTCKPVNGKRPRKAAGPWQKDVAHFARHVNGGFLTMVRELPAEYRDRLLAQNRNRYHEEWEL